MSFANPHFEEPAWLWLAVLGPVLLAFLLRFAARERKAQLARVASPRLLSELTRSHSAMRRFFKHTLLLLSVALLGLALARPQWGELESRPEVLSEDVVFVLDCSRSMLATDVAPNRLQRAKYSILDFVRRHGTGRVGVVAFAGAAFLQCPLTFDYDAFEEALAEMDARTIPVGGTDIGRALAEAFHAMEKKSERKCIVLLTDGEDLEKSGVKEAEQLAEAGVTVYTIGVGTAAGAELRVMTPTGQMDFVRDERGQVVRSRLDESTLTAIAKATGGTYEPLGRLGEGLAKVREAIEVKTAKGFARTNTQGVERFHVPLAVALVLLVVESLTGTRRRGMDMSVNRHTTPAVTSTARAGVVAGIVTLICCAASGAVESTTNNPSPVKPPPPPATARDAYNAGTQLLAAGKLTEAETMFQNAVARQDEPVQARALYNLGLSRFELGREELKKSPPTKPSLDRGDRANAHGVGAIQTAEAALAANEVQQMVAAYIRGRGARKELRAAYEAVYRALEMHGKTLEKWRRSLGDFRGTAELNPADTNALHNAVVVERAIAELVDSLRRTQMLALQCSGNCSKLGDLLSELKGKIPADQMPPGAPGEGEEEELGEPKLEELAGMKESESKDGKEMELSLSPDEAAQVLDGFKLGGNRRLPMGKEEPGQPQMPRKLRDW